MTGSYDFEEQERIAELKAWWEDNRWFVAGGIVVAILTFAGYRGWHWWSQQRAEDAMAMYQPAPATAISARYPPNSAPTRARNQRGERSAARI